MAETTADVKRDIELTRDRISNTLSQLEQKVHVTQMVKDNPWPALGLALGAGYLLSGSSVDVRASASTLAATRGASSKLGGVLDDVVANLMGGLSAAFEQKVEGLVNELKGAIGAPTAPGANRPNASSSFMSNPTPSAAGSQSMQGGADGAGSSSPSYGTGATSGAAMSAGGASSYPGARAD